MTYALLPERKRSCTKASSYLDLWNRVRFVPRRIPVNQEETLSISSHDVFRLDVVVNDTEAMYSLQCRDLKRGLLVQTSEGTEV